MKNAVQHVASPRLLYGGMQTIRNCVTNVGFTTKEMAHIDLQIYPEKEKSMKMCLTRRNFKDRHNLSEDLHLSIQ